MDDIRHLDDSKMVTPNDVRRVKFTGKTSLFTRRDWYDADEVDDFLDEYVSVTIR